MSEEEDIRDAWDAQQQLEERRQWELWLSEDLGYFRFLEEYERELCQQEQ